MQKTFFRRLGEVFGRERAAASDLATRFRDFQAVLDGNNRTLEAMTEMGEKLGGEYLFDVNYTRTAYATLFSAISDSLRHFNLLTDGQYPQLAGILARINTLVQRMLSGSEPPASPLVVFYPEITWDQAEEVGGKNYHLAELANSLHLRIPEAFAITTTAFTAFLRHNGLEARLVGLAKADGAALTELRRAILVGGFPEDFSLALTSALARMRDRLGQGATLAVRSSAEEEDGEYSFAGQFETKLNVPCTVEAVQAAYKQVVASLFQANSTSYQRQLGYDLGTLKMAVGCVAMIAAKTSGVIYTAAAGKDRSRMAISAAWGLGPGVVDGLTDADLYTVAKEDGPRLVERRIGGKAQMVVNQGTSGIATVETPAAQRSLACLSEPQVLELSRQALAIEKYYKVPQDIEWAMDSQDRCYLLQARALRVAEDAPAETGSEAQVSAALGYPVLLRDQGIVVQRGATAGKVFILQHLDDLEKIPKGSILVARHDSPHFVQAIPILHAIITDIGVPTSHMASICREFSIPTVVNTGSATSLLHHGQAITLQTGGDGSMIVYEGIVQGLLREERQTAAKLRELYEFRRQKYIMRYIAPLHLVNSLEQEFVPEKCTTVHDLIRFMHEKAMQALVANAEGQGRGINRFFGGKTALHRLTLPIPVQLAVIDLGGGLRTGSKTAGFAEVASVPLRAVLAGMLAPGVWQNEGVALRGADLLSGMTRADNIAGGAAIMENVALAGSDYVNMSLRFGYHFNMLDCYCSDTPRNNHIYFRFVGGAAAITNRSRRIALMAQVLAEHGFALKAKGDLLVGRLSGLGRQEIEGILEQLGRLIGFTRQLDARLDSDETVEILARRFLAGDYRLDP